MCGFTVILKKKRSYSFNKKKFFSSSSKIAHRGPDDHNNYISQNILMDFYRLSILDLSSNGRQPMKSFSGRYVIVYNGEIYNKEKLKKKINFKKLKGTSDTEILLNLFEKYRLKCLDYLDGMYSFVIYDTKDNKLYFARDRLGIKPLYFFENENFFFFSSEIKPIINYTNKNNLNPKSVYDFFINQRMDHFDKTFFKNVRSIEPAQFGKIYNNKIRLGKYWNIVKPTMNIDDGKALNTLKKLFSDSVENHLLSDVDVGLFLSGGSDSTALAHNIRKFQKKITTYTYDFVGSGKYGELSKAEKISKRLNMKNINCLIKPNYIKDNFDKLTEILESPFTSIRLFGDFKLYEKCKRNNTKVILVGHGGDELLAGYKYNELANQKENNNLPLNSKFGFYDLSNQNTLTKDCSNYLFRENFDKEFLSKYSNENYEMHLNSKSLLKNSQLIDIKNVNLPRSLKYADRLSMYNGIESRVPFLQHELSKFLFNLNSTFKFRNGDTRWIFKNYLRKTNVSRFLTKKKKAIADPQRTWFKKELKDFFMDRINSSSFKNCDFFNYKNIKNNYEKLTNNKINSSFNLFQILTFHSFVNVYKNFKK